MSQKMKGLGYEQKIKRKIYILQKMKNIMNKHY